jgi:hypothetical protein
LPPGVNLPWLDYGVDFGANAWRPRGGLADGPQGERLEAALRAVASAGARVVRWFVLGDGRAGLRMGADERPLGLDDRVTGDLEAALRALERHGLQAMFVLTDFLWFARPRVHAGVFLFGKRRLAADPSRRLELLDRVVSPLVERFAGDPRIHSWDAFNEPEWAVLGLGSRDPRATLLDRQMKSYLGDLVARLRAGTPHPVTVGLASPRGLGLVRSLGLDFYQWHWYDSVEKATPLSRPVAEYGLDRPVLLGEFPTRGSSRSPEEIRRTARAAGYAAAWPWSLCAEDEASDRGTCLAALGPPISR